MNLGLKNKLVLVTGSTSGIGKEIAKGFLCENARVIINGRNKNRVDEVVNELSKYGQVQGVAADISSSQGQNQIIEFVNAIGPIEILVNNAAIYSRKDYFDIKIEELQKLFQINVFSMLQLTQAFLPIMMNANFGRIINISSEAAFKPYTHLIPYSMSKAAVVNFTKGISEIAAGSCITANSILPGPTMTRELKEHLHKVSLKESKSVEELIEDRFRRNNPTSVIQRYIQADEVAGVALYLASEKAAAITGSSVRVEGGILSTI